MPRPGPPYSPEFRAEAVRLLRSSGKTAAELSRELGVSEPTLRRWRRQAGDDGGEVASPATAEDSAPSTAEDSTPSTAEDSTPSTFPEDDVRRLRFTHNQRGKGRSVRILARLTAEVIDVGIAVVTAPAKWTASGLRWYADHRDEPPAKAPEGQDGEGPAAAA